MGRGGCGLDHDGALFLGKADAIGTLAQGKQADMVVVQGNPASDITAIRRTAMVFKDGVGYDSAAILQTVAGRVGRE
jgi:imidazolonepropionase-like amidohydrolase